MRSALMRSAITPTRRYIVDGSDARPRRDARAACARPFLVYAYRPPGRRAASAGRSTRGHCFSR